MHVPKNNLKHRNIRTVLFIFLIRVMTEKTIVMSRFMIFFEGNDLRGKKNESRQIFLSSLRGLSKVDATHQ